VHSNITFPLSAEHPFSIYYILWKSVLGEGMVKHRFEMQKLTSFLNEWTVLSKPLVKLVSLVIQPCDIPSSHLDLFICVEEESWIWKPSIHIPMHIYHKSVTPQYRTTVICGHDSLWKVIPSYKVFWFPTTHDIPSPLMQRHKS